ncbi:hypothetical protein HK102_000228 [Quaeritorhiza haematococci]|nr:hypothetical protein HK102_000228 [Quaeritorhiza haematococci]
MAARSALSKSTFVHNTALFTLLQPHAQSISSSASLHSSKVLALRSLPRKHSTLLQQTRALSTTRHVLDQTSQQSSPASDQPYQHRPRKLAPGETPNPRNYSAPHPAFPGSSSLSSNTRSRVIALVIGATVSLFTLGVAYAHTEASVDAKDGEEDSLPEVGVVVPLSHKDNVARATQNPGVFLWGSNKYMLLDPESGKDGIVRDPTSFKFFEGQALRDLVFSERHAAAVDINGDIYQWGSAFSSPTSSSSQPTKTLQGRDVIQIACTDSKLYALTRKGQVYCLSANQNQQSEDLQNRISSGGGRPTFFTPSWWWLRLFAPSSDDWAYTKLRLPQKYKGDKVASIAAGAHHLVAVTAKGRVCALPADSKGNRNGQLGIGFVNESDPKSNTEDVDLKTGFAVDLMEVRIRDVLEGASSARPVDEAGAWKQDLKAVQVACGEEHTLVRTADGRVFGFGANHSGQLGTGADFRPVNHVIPTPISIATLWSRFAKSHLPPPHTSCTHIAAGGQTSLFVIDKPTESELLACGNGQWGQLGNGGFVHVQPQPVRVKGTSGLVEWDEKLGKVVPIRVREVVCGNNHCAAVLDNAVETYGCDVLVWGQNSDGQLARGDGKKGMTGVPVWPRGIAYDDKNNKEKEVKVEDAVAAGHGESMPTVGRLQIAPAGNVQVSVGGKKKTVKAEQSIACGYGVTAVYTKVVKP